MIDFEKVTLGDLRQLGFMLGHPMNATTSPFVVGKSYLLRTVTNYWTGRVDSIQGSFLVLGDAAWIADTGRFSEATTAEKLNEVEPVVGPVIVSLGSLVDACEWATALPRKQK